MRAIVLLALACACARQRESSAMAAHVHERSHEHHAGMHPHAAATMNHRFDDAEAWAKKFDDPARDDWQKPEAVVAALGLAEDSLVADVGAGTGYFAVRLARAVPRGKVFASDVEPDMVRYLGERARREGLSNIVPVQGTAADAALPEPVDVVLLCDVVHHIADRPAFFAKLRERLRAGGRIVIVDFAPDAPDGPGPPREHRLAIEQLDTELASVGLRRTAVDRELLRYQYVVRYEPR